MMQEVDGLRFEARDVVNLQWLKQYGKVFYVFDQQDSGNLCFGVNGPYGKLFIKYAGAKTMNYMGKPADAVLLLRNAMPMYQIRHPALIQLKAHGAVLGGLGYAAIFNWVDGACLRPNPPDPKVLDRLRHLPLPMRLGMLDEVFDLHARLAEEGYVSVDFDDSNILVDFALGKIYVGDIDRYCRRPLINHKGRMPGSSRFRAPEAFVQGETMTESTMVYEMGKLAHLFLGNIEDPVRENWQGPELLFRVAHQAVQDKKNDRYPSMRTFLHAWRTAVRDSWLR